jgi:hypothetical protein
MAFQFCSTTRDAAEAQWKSLAEKEPLEAISWQPEGGGMPGQAASTAQPVTSTP